MAAEPRLLLVRHGESEANVAGTLQGQSHGTLTTHGRKAATQLAVRLASLAADERPTSVLSSDLQRAAETARIIAGPLGLTPEPTPIAREWNVGVLDGSPASVLHEVVLASSLPYWEFLPSGGESLCSVRDRASTLAEMIQDELRDPAIAPRRFRTVLVTHGDFIRMMLSMTGALRIDDAVKLTLRNTSITELALVDNAWRIVRINDAVHLEE